MNSPTPIPIALLMETSGVTFGTSGARGLVEDMTDAVCYAYTIAFLQYLEQRREIAPGSRVAVSGDRRPSTGRIKNAVIAAIRDRLYLPVNCGRIPSPAVAYYGLEKGIPSVMVTGSHIPDDRNGIKFNKPGGEILKDDEQGIAGQQIALPDGRFDAGGGLTVIGKPCQADTTAFDHYVRRYLEFFDAGCLEGKRIGLYEHSSVAREALHAVLEGLGAEVIPLAASEIFIPVDTEAVRPEDVQLAKEWAQSHHFDAIVSADGDGDRPLVSDEHGGWLRGDVAGILCARYLEADAVAVPVSCNSALEKSAYFRHVQRTRIGSPYVIRAMNEALRAGWKRVVGYEANGGFLLGSDIHKAGRTLKALPTRDAVLPILALLVLAVERHQPLSRLLEELPKRHTASDRIKEFPLEISAFRLRQLARAPARAAEMFAPGCGQLRESDQTDGLRLTFENGEIIHIRPSGNAPELRCYTEAHSPERAHALNAACMRVLHGWKGGQRAGRRR